MSVCYNLIACTNSYPDILGITDVILTPYIDQLISIDGDDTKKYYVKETHQLVAASIDNMSDICFGGGVPLTWEISSIFYNGIEKVTFPQTYNLNIGNLLPLNCIGTSCIPGTCPTADNQGNLALFLNNVFTLFDIPLTATPSGFITIDGGHYGILINATQGDDFLITITRTAGNLSPFTYEYGIDIGQNSVYNVEGNNSDYHGITLNNCAGSLLGITSIVVETICEGCGCPPGYIPSSDGLECTLFESVAVVQNPTTYTAGLGTFATGVYGSESGQFYEDITNKPWPIIATNGACPIIAGICSILNDNTLVPLVVTNLVANQIWGGVSSALSATFRIKVAGIWTTIAPAPVNEWIGFAYCFTLTETKTYYLAFAVDDVAKFYLDGVLMIDHSTVGWSFRTWKIIPVTMNAGTHIFDGRVKNFGGSATFAFEIYDATLAQLLAVANPGDLEPYIVFTTADYIGQTWQTGEVSGYTCPNGYSLNTCSGIVCSRTIVIPSIPCCYVLTSCDNNLIAVNTSTDLSAYVGQTVTIDLFPGCFKVTVSAEPCYQPVPVVVIGFFPDCDTCNPCYVLTNCVYPLVTLEVTNDLSNQIGDIVLVNGDCWTITGLALNCDNSLPVTINQTYITCYECLPKCYNLIDCTNPLLVLNVATDLSQYVGQVIHIKNCGDTCWIVEETLECIECLQVEVIETFVDCLTCIPPPPELPPIELHPRKVKPGYDTPGCPPEYTEKVNCNYSEYLYNEVLSKRYGIKVCCQEDRLKWEIKKHLLDLKTIYDPNLCKSTINRCCPPSCVESRIYVFQAVTCPAPTNVISVIVTPGSCFAPTSVTSYLEEGL